MESIWLFDKDPSKHSRIRREKNQIKPKDWLSHRFLCFLARKQNPIAPFFPLMKRSLLKTKNIKITGWFGRSTESLPGALRKSSDDETAPLAPVDRTEPRLLEFLLLKDQGERLPR